MYNGGCSQLPLSRRRRPICSRYLLVEIPSDNDNDGDREDLLAMYEAVERAARGTSPVAALAEEQSRESTNDGGGRQNLLMESLARFVCPYFGLVRVRIGTETVSSWPRGSTKYCTAPRSLPTSPGASGQEKTRFYLALGDPREGMRSPCTLTIKIETNADPALVPPSQVWYKATPCKYCCRCQGQERVISAGSYELIDRCTAPPLLVKINARYIPPIPSTGSE